MIDTDAMVEAAARALYELDDDGDIWDDARPGIQIEFRRRASAALAAAALAAADEVTTRSLSLAIAEEREECAKVADEHAVLRRTHDDFSLGARVVAEDIAALIRSRSTDQAGDHEHMSA